MSIYSKKSGYSLVEMVIYVAILSAISLVIINMLISFTKSYQTLGALRVAEHSGIDFMERVTREIRGATSVDSANSTLGTSPGVLTLVSTFGGVSTTTKFYVQNGIIKMDVNGVYFGPLTVSNSSTTNLTFTSLANSVSSAVKVDLTVQGTAGTATRVKSYHSTIILRGN